MLTALLLVIFGVRRRPARRSDWHRRWSSALRRSWLLHFGIPIREAIGASLVAVITTSAASSSVHLQRHTTDIRLGMTLELATALEIARGHGIPRGLFQSQRLGRTLRRILTLQFDYDFAEARQESRRRYHSPSEWRCRDSSVRDSTLSARALAASLIAGALSELLGIGGDPIKVPVMFIFMNVPLMVATATSNFMIGVTAAASAIVYYRRGDIEPQIAAPLAVGVFLGSLLGARLAPRIDTRIVMYLLVAVMLYLAGHLVVHLLQGGL